MKETFKEFCSKEPKEKIDEAGSLLITSISSLVQIQKQLAKALKSGAYDDIIRTIDKSLTPLAKTIKNEAKQEKADKALTDLKK